MKFKARLPVISNRTITVGVLIGITSAVLGSLLLTAGAASLISRNRLPEESSKWIVPAIRTITVLFGTLIGTGVVKEKCLATMGIIAVGYLILLLGLGIVFYNGSFQHFGAGILSALAGGVAGCLIRLKSQNKLHRARKLKG